MLQVPYLYLLVVCSSLFCLPLVATFSPSLGPTILRSTYLEMGPPLPPSQCGTIISVAGKSAPILIECYLDLICPYSSKMYGTLYKGVLPKLDGDIIVVIHQVIQPWHPQGTAVHEAALAVKQVCPEAYTTYLNAVYTAFDKGEYNDDKTWDKSRLQIYDDLLALVPSNVDAAKVKSLLMPTGTGGNEGNAMLQEIKWAVKTHRTRGVHITPTVFVNGLEASVVSSGWTAAEWLSFLESKGADNFRAEKV
jgi:protein-disulfide isomerase